ncbi:TIGR00730 family Rossman fold protein [Adhaeribacter aerolatus]|nr:TIGR00730 family Rossman fold protein [Adhaeribacter aerolatus]
MKSIAVFCGANNGNSPVYAAAAKAFGELLARESITLVFGGGKVGLMGIIADSVLAAGGSAIGVIPQSLVAREVAHDNLTQLHVVETMHERKALMASLSDGFVAMPGGLGTFDEICEIITWNQLGILVKPCAFLNVNGYFNPLIQMFDTCVTEGFLRQERRDSLIIEEDGAKILEKIRQYEPLITDKWTDLKKA